MPLSTIPDDVRALMSRLADSTDASHVQANKLWAILMLARSGDKIETLAAIERLTSAEQKVMLAFAAEQLAEVMEKDVWP
jgi:hypothetical protein